MAYFIVNLILTILFLFFGAEFVFASDVLLNEFLPHPSNGEDWIEIYNPTSNSIDLSGWTLVDSTSTMKPLSGTITANGFLTFDVSDRLNNGKDSIYLKDSSGTLVDNVPYNSDPGIDKSIGRSPDGGSWAALASISRNSTNGSPSSPTPAPSPSPSPISSFTISNSLSQINSDQSFDVTLDLTLTDNPSTIFYLKGAFKKSDSANYFGLTKVGSAWIKNGSTFSDQYKITTNSSGNWSGNLEVMPDSEDSGFSGTGEYIFKVGRYNQSGSGPIWSNEVTIKITSTTSNNQSNTSNNLTPKPSPVTSPALSVTSKTAPSSKADNQEESIYKIASVAGIKTESAPPSSTPNSEVKSQKQINFPQIAGIFLLISGFSSIFYIYLRKKKS